MKPIRAELTLKLVEAYGLLDSGQHRMHSFTPPPASSSRASMADFHSLDYLEFLQHVTPENSKHYASLLEKYNLGNFDCPISEGIFEYCQLYCSGSIGAAIQVNHGLADIAVNWSGGMHHARAGEARGFCYGNDCVLAILELLKVHSRVLYVDIDIHHGDGVQEAFYSSHRVCTVSFHQYGNDFYPGTGSVDETGAGPGAGYSINVPLTYGVTDETYSSVFEPVMNRVVEKYRPGAVVLQCGADPLNGDAIGVWNMSIRGHGKCVSYFRSLGLPLVVLGGGGYTLENVVRCWTHETGCLLGVDLPNELPISHQADTSLSLLGPTLKLHSVTPDPREINANRKKSLRRIVSQIMTNIDDMEAAPGVTVQTGWQLKTPGLLDAGGWRTWGGDDDEIGQGARMGDDQAAALLSHMSETQRADCLRMNYPHTLGPGRREWLSTRWLSPEWVERAREALLLRSQIAASTSCAPPPKKRFLERSAGASRVSSVG
jgi:histone deacetylase 1/2